MELKQIIREIPDNFMNSNLSKEHKHELMLLYCEYFDITATNDLKTNFKNFKAIIEFYYHKFDTLCDILSFLDIYKINNQIIFKQCQEINDLFKNFIINIFTEINNLHNQRSLTTPSFQQNILIPKNYEKYVNEYHSKQLGHQDTMFNFNNKVRLFSSIMQIFENYTNKIKTILQNIEKYNIEVSKKNIDIIKLKLDIYKKFIKEYKQKLNINNWNSYIYKIDCLYHRYLGMTTTLRRYYDDDTTKYTKEYYENNCSCYIRKADEILKECHNILYI
jgi:hypothetical protein